MYWCQNSTEDQTNSTVTVDDDLNQTNDSSTSRTTDYTTDDNTNDITSDVTTDPYSGTEDTNQSGVTSAQLWTQPWTPKPGLNQLEYRNVPTLVRWLVIIAFVIAFGIYLVMIWLMCHQFVEDMNIQNAYESRPKSGKSIAHKEQPEVRYIDVGLPLTESTKQDIET